MKVNKLIRYAEEKGCYAASSSEMYLIKEEDQKLEVKKVLGLSVKITAMEVHKNNLVVAVEKQGYEP